MTEREIFLAAIELPDVAAQSAFLDKVCVGNPVLRQRVEGLLRSHESAGSFLVMPVVAPEDSDYAGTQVYSPTPVPGEELTCSDGRVNGPDTEEVALSFLARATRPDSLGRIGHYEVLQVLGKGGFGIVFRAFDDMLQRVVAVKVLAPEIATTSPARKRFLREARSSAQVRHENVVQVYEVGEQPLPFLVMEFIPGETLQERLDRVGPLEVAEVLRIGRQLAEGLAAAHTTDLIHRDIKPGNILLEGGQHKVKITDFGLARAADDASISQSGVIAGTPMFMAPEQAKGERMDHRADLFSLGSVLYQMVTGRPPFRANGTLAVLKRVSEHTPRAIREIIPETPQWLIDIIKKLHEKDPDDRYQSAREVADVLTVCEERLKTNARLQGFAPAVPKTRAASSGNRKWVAAVAGVLAIAGIVTTVALLGDWSKEPRRDGSVAGTQKPVEPPPQPGPQPKQPAPIPTGFGGVPPKPIRGEGSSVPYSYSPDGKWLVTRDFDGKRVGTLRVWDVATGELRTTRSAAVSQDRAGAFSPDGSLFAHAECEGNQGYIVVLRTDTFEVVKRWACDSNGREGIEGMAFDRTGTVLGVSVGHTVMLWNARTGAEVTRITGDFHQPLCVAFSPTADLLALQDGRGAAERNGRWEHDSRVLLYDIDPKSPKYKQRLHTWDAPDDGFAIDLRFTPDGAHVLFCRGTGGLIRLAFHDVKTGEQRREIVPQQTRTHIHCGPVSPDRKRLALRHGHDGVHVSVWNLDDGTRASQFDLPGQPHRSFVVDPTFRTVCAGFHTGPEAKFFDLATGKELVPGFAPQPFGADDLKRIAALPPAEQVEEVRKALMTRNPGFDGKLEHTIEGDAVTELGFCTDRVNDISPLRALTALSKLGMTGTPEGNGLLTDLSPLKGLPITQLSLRHNSKLTDLSPLEGMPLKSLDLVVNPVTDLSPLKGAKLELLLLWGWNGADLSPLKGMPLKFLNVGGNGNVRDISALQGLPLETLYLSSTSVADLAPLKEKRLTTLGYANTKVRDLSPVKDMPLEHVECDFEAERDAAILKGIRTLKTINRKPAAEYLKEVPESPVAPFTDADVKRIAAMTAVEQLEEVRRELKKRNPGYDGTFTQIIENDVVVALILPTRHVADLSPIRGLTKLTWLEAEGAVDNPGILTDLSALKGLPLTGLWVRQNKLADLTPLKGMPLRKLAIENNPISDFSVLKELPLKDLSFQNNPIQDLKGLAGLKLEYLSCIGIPITDLTPLKGMPLKGLSLHATEVADLTPLKGMKLEELNIERTKVADLSPLQGMPLTTLVMTETAVTDLTPLKDLPLKTLVLDFKPERDATILKGIKTLEFINRKPAADFLKEVEKK